MKQVLYLIIGLFACLSCAAQSDMEASYSVQKEYLESNIEKTNVDEKAWRKATKGLEYTVPKKRRTRSLAPAPSGKLGGDGRVVLTILVIILAGVLIAFAIAYFTGWVSLGAKEKDGKTVSIEDIENNIFETDLEAMIRQALSKQDYKLAVRLYFLSILKELSIQKKIRWKKDKTNRAYAFELIGTPMHLPFQKLALIFDRIRYGGEDLDQSSFKGIEPAFTGFIKEINPKLLSQPSYE